MDLSHLAHQEAIPMQSLLAHTDKLCYSKDCGLLGVGRRTAILTQDPVTSRFHEELLAL